MNKRVISLFLAMVMVFSAVVSANGFSTSVYAAEDTVEQITVYLAAQGKNAAGTSVSIGKVAMQVSAGTTADVLVKEVLDSSEYEYQMPDTGYGPYLESINGMGTEQAGNDWYYWSFYVNGAYSNVGMGSYQLQDNDKISLIYSYQDMSMEAQDFVDDATMNPATEQAVYLKNIAIYQQDILAGAIYQKQFGQDYIIPGIEDTNGLFTVFSLIRAGFVHKYFFEAVYKKVAKQLNELKVNGKTYDVATGKEITEESILNSGVAELFYAKIVLAVSAIGWDATNINGYNLIEKMAQKTVYAASAESYTTEATMLLALDCNQYSLPTGNKYITRSELVDKLADNVETQIGSSIQWGVDMAAINLQPLAPYTKEGNLASQEDASFNTDKIKKICSKGIHFLESMQSADGLYGDSWTENNAWSLSQVMTVLGQFGINPTSEKDGSDFIKNGKTVLDAVEPFINIENQKVKEELMSYQPEQLLRGLNSCIRVMEGERSVYDTVNASSDIPMPIVTPEPVVTSTVLPTASVGATCCPISYPRVELVTTARDHVVLNPGKSTQVKYRAVMSNNETVLATVSSANKKVATAKVVGEKVKISVPKKAVRGKSTKVTLKYGNKKAVIKVAVKNSAKSLKLVPKKTITLKKRRKIVISIRVKAQNPKKPINDTIKITTKKSTVTATKTVVKQGKLTITLKGMKKGKDTISLRVGNAKTEIKTVVK